MKFYTIIQKQRECWSQIDFRFRIADFGFWSSNLSQFSYEKIRCFCLSIRNPKSKIRNWDSSNAPFFIALIISRFDLAKLNILETFFNLQYSIPACPGWALLQ
jgi:hypothetical protein